MQPPANRDASTYPPGRGEAAYPQYCAQPPSPPRVMSPNVTGLRLEAIFALDRKWLNGTVIHYYFFDRPTDGTTVVLSNGQKEFRSWVGDNDQREVVRRAFKTWKELGIGLEFVEVNSRTEAEVRIGFMLGDGSYSAVGTDVLKRGSGERTMNFGWRLVGSQGHDTALHEIGHTLGLEHEHQNPFAGIVWNEEAVYTTLAAPPNNWDREKTHWNIIRKISPNEVQGSSWDANSIMHYPFGPGLIRSPHPFDATGVRPAGGLSERDKTWVRTFYPPQTPSAFPTLGAGLSQFLPTHNGDQQDFVVRPEATRKYNIGTFGSCDSIVALFEEENGNPRFITADDDSGEDRNARLRVKLLKGRKYIVRAQVRFVDLTSPPFIMMW
ncbi:MAG TPA: M12 family metallopeptidase [Longimicrobium sp.]|nr:M12 family metallopeptidase [Longimicrobium sp.]